MECDYCSFQTIFNNMIFHLKHLCVAAFHFVQNSEYVKLVTCKCTSLRNIKVISLHKYYNSF